ncbi:MAG: adenylate/guanylate cyclase domain-containing protein [Chloroflexi bacterium]|nr:adenylate/guanylate cyclase domain-containing protein [Chloroflexota bacterium]
MATTLLADPKQAALGGEVRDVTVLFADLRGFTPFSERVDPAEVVALLNRYFAAAVPVILAEGGTIAQFVGDAVMAIFNAPDDLDDHAAHAARAAIGMQRAIAAVAGDDPRVPRFRIGVHSGPSLVGNIGSPQVRQYTAIGDTTNLAARLQTMADEGQVVVSGTTYERIRDRVTARGLGALTIKGKRDPVEAWELSAWDA